MSNKDIPPEVIPGAVVKASLDLVHAINDSGPRCIGVVIVVVFDDTERVIPIIDSDVRSTSHEDPKTALLEQANKALVGSLERRKAVSPGIKN